MLHVVSGQHAAAAFAAAGMAGEVLPWRDMLAEGPTFEDARAATGRLKRAEWLDTTFGIPPETYLLGLAEQDRALDELGRHEEVVLWFGDDLFCVANLLSLLAWLAHEDLGTTRLALVTTHDSDPRDVPGLMWTRRPVTDVEMQAGLRTWRAWCSADPLELLPLLHAEPPAFARAMQADVRRFPGVTSGVDEVEHAALFAIGNGCHDPRELFRTVSAFPTIARHGMADLQFWAVLERLRGGDHPLVALHGAPRLPRHGDLPEALLEHARLHLTDAGRPVLDGHADWAQLGAAERWVGGVHVGRTRPIWSWDESSLAIVRR
jgi:hypothetical protein